MSKTACPLKLMHALKEGNTGNIVWRQEMLRLCFVCFKTSYCASVLIEFRIKKKIKKNQIIILNLHICEHFTFESVSCSGQN